MRRILPFLVVLAAGIAIGYFVAPRGAPTPRQAAPEFARTDDGIDVVSPPAREDASLPDPVLQGRPTETPARSEEPAQPAAPRVTSDGRVAVVVKVILPNGGVPAAARVHWASDPDAAIRSMRHMAWKPPQASAFVRPGEVWLLATGGTRGSLISERVPVRVSAQKPLPEVLLTLQDRAGIHGKVVLPAEFDRPRLSVKLLRYAGHTPPEKPIFDRTAPSVRPRARDGYGFAFHDLRPGGYLLGLSLGRRDAVVVKDVRVRDSMVEQDLVVAAFDPKQYMEVTVLGPKGQPLRDAQVSISFSSDGRAIAGGNVALLRDDGTFIVDHLPGHTLREDGTYEDGVFTVRVRTQEHGEIVRPYDPSSTPTLTIRVGELQDLAVQLTGYSATSVPPHLSVAVRAVGETGVRNPQGAGPNGSVHFGERPPGSYEVVLMAGQPRQAVIAVHPIEFAPGDAVKEVPTPVFCRLVLRLPKNAVEPAFRLSRTFGKEQWSYGWAQADEAGDMVFEYLTEGTYRLEGHVGERWVKREVRLPAESVVRLD